MAALMLDASDRVVAANREARGYFSIDPGRLPQSILEATRESRLGEVVRGGAREAEVVLSHRRRTVRTRLIPGPSAGLTVLFLSDVTDLRRLEVVRQEFVANLSHELRTPLTSLRLAVESLEGDPPAEARRRFAARALKEADHLAAIVDNLRQLAEIEAGRVEVRRSGFEIAPLVRETADRVLEGRPLNLSVPPGLSVSSDRSKLGEVLSILLENAVRYSPEGSAVDVSADRDGEVVIEVRDHGPGLSPEHWERVFERFYKADRARSRELGGSGLGLAIAKHLVQALGGRIWTQAHPDGGQVFAVALPDAEA